MTISYNGERYIPGVPGIIELEHLHRYALALPLCRGKRVLDVASGEGYGANLLATAAQSVVGVDISGEAIAHAADRYRAENLAFIQGSCANLPLDDESVDLVVSFETIEHHDQHEAMMQEFVRVLRPDGLLLISSPNKETYSDIPGTHNPFHVKELYLDDFASLLRNYFLNVNLYGQRVLTSSLVAPLESSNGGFRLIRPTEGGIENANNVDPAIYYIALASKTSSLPSFGVSAYESLAVRGVQPESQLAPAFFEAKCYWRRAGQEYSELETLVSQFPVNGQLQDIRLVFGAEATNVQRVRLDLMDGVGIVEISALQFLAPDNSVIWQWGGDLPAFRPKSQCILMPEVSNGAVGCMVVSLQSDPWFELDIPTSAYDRITPGCALVLTLRPFHLLDRLPFILSGLSKYQSHPQQQALLIPPSFVPAHFSQDLESIEALIASSLSSRDRIIEKQSIKLKTMREELIRAEAQLDLLKNVMLLRRD